MIYIQFVIGFLLYSIMAYISYSESFKQSKWFFLTGIGLAILVNAIWFSIAKNEAVASKLVLKGLYWDVMLTAAYLVIPLILFQAKLSLLQALGVGLIVLGVLFTKI